MAELEPFGNMPDGQPVWSVTIGNSKGMKVKIITCGAIINKVLVPDGKNGYTDVVLGKDTLEQYLSDGSSAAAVIGRVANRIGKATFELNGKKYDLLANDRGNCLHGGSGMYGMRNFQVAGITETSVKLALFDNGEGGFPGEVNLTVKYTVTEDNTLILDYTAVSTEDTPINLTNHVYFNLEGQQKGDIFAQEIKIDADYYTPCDDTVLPTGEIISVEGTALDFRKFKQFDKALKDLENSGGIYGGFDHNIVLNGRGYRRISVARDPKSGLFMETYTDLPGVQLYTANGITERAGKDGATYHKHAGFCLETQFFPDTINKGHFPGGILKKGEVFTTRTAFKFGYES